MTYEQFFKSLRSLVDTLEAEAKESQVINFQRDQVAVDDTITIEVLNRVDDLCRLSEEQALEDPCPDPGDMDGDAQSALASAGLGTDEDYNHGDFGGEEF